MIQVYTLGTARIDVGASTVTPSSRRRFAMLLYLAVEAGRRISRASLHELLYPEQSEIKAGHALRELVYQLRRVGVPLDTKPDGIMLAADAVRIDNVGIGADAPLSAQTLRQIGGGLLPTYAPSHSEAYVEWLDGYRATTVPRLVRAVLRTASDAKTSGDWQACEYAARTCLALDPTNDEATFMAAEMLALGGSKVRGLEMLDQYIRGLDGKPEALRIPVELLRRRISERIPSGSQPKPGTRFVGRADEMRALEEALAGARRGRVQCLIIQGEAGIGKTRLASEFSSKCALLGCRIAKVSVQPIDRQHPMAGFIDLVPQLLSLPGAAGCSPDSMALLDRLTLYDPLGAEPSAPGIAESNDVRAARLFRAITDVIGAVASEGPLVVLVDDAQWLDDVSRRTIRYLATRGEAAKLLLILNTRPDAAKDIIGDPAPNVIPLLLGPLDEDSCTRLVSEALASDERATHSLRAWMCEVAHGNPFFLDCLIAHYWATGEQFVIPREISALLDQRVGTLSPHASQVLATTAALGKHATIDRLIRVLEVPAHWLIQAFDELERQCLIQGTSVVEVRHRLIADAISRRNTVLATRLLHRRIAETLRDEAVASHDAALLWACAEHWVAAGDERMAAASYRACAQHSIEMGRAREAAELLLRAAEFDHSESEVPLLEAALRTAVASAETDVALQALVRLNRVPRAFRHDDTELAELGALSRTYTSHEEVMQRLEGCMSETTATIEHRLVSAFSYFAFCDQLRMPHRAHAAYAQIRRLCETPAEADRVNSLKALLIYHCAFGDAELAGDVASQLYRIAADIPDHLAADLYRKVSIGFWRAGRCQESIEALEASYGASARNGLERTQLAVAAMLAGNYADMGNWEAADYWLERSTKLRATSEYDLGFLCSTTSGEIAVARNDRPAVVETLRLFAQDPGMVGQSVEHWYRSAMLYLKITAGDEVDGEAERHHFFDRRIAASDPGDISDFEAAMIALTLLYCGRHDSARQTLSSYLVSFRRPRAPLSNAFVQVARALNDLDLPEWSANVAKLPRENSELEKLARTFRAQRDRSAARQPR